MDGFDAALIDTFTQCDRIYLGFSGGLDSCVLLHQMCQHAAIRQKLIAIHIHHGLSQFADDWVTSTKKTCDEARIAYQCFYVMVDTKNIEASARDARYAVFSTLLVQPSDILLLAHHQNDQAETLLLHLFRGAGIDGLAAMPVSRPLGAGHLYRPLLNIPRTDLLAYAKKNQLAWIEDESNQDNTLNRNFLRNIIIPQLQIRWPGLISNISRTAMHCASARQLLRNVADDALQSKTGNQLSINTLTKYPRDMQMLLLRRWLKKQRIQLPSYQILTRIIDELMCASNDANPLVTWKTGEVRRYQGVLYAFVLPLNDHSVPLLDAQIDVRFRKGGEKIRWHGKTRDLKKLFQTWKIPPWERDKIPLIYRNNTLVCVQGYVVSDDFNQHEIGCHFP